MSTPFEQFLRGYLAALWWSSTVCIPSDLSESGNEEMVNLDEYEPSDEALASCRADCQDFFDANRSDIDLAADSYNTSSGDGADTGYDFAGHDFALTRNHHGAGYWDGDIPKDLGDRLTAASHAAGPAEAYIGDDGLINI